ncbi:MAG: PAS domain S-box protein [Methanoregula sp.]|nr:PAS domain S-box protein [Methanoregula sp.]
MADLQDTDESAQIRAVLRDHPLGMSIKEISAAVAMSRNSVAKYLEVLTASGQLELRHVGNAKLYMLSHRVPVGDLLNHAKEFIIVLDNDLRVVQASSSFCGFTGLPREKVLHARLSALPLPLLTAAEEQKMAILLGGGPSWKKQIRVARNGSEVYFEGRFIPATLENGVSGITVILEDVTDRTYAEKAMAERDRLLRTIFQIPTSPQFFIDRNHKVVYWDRALEIMTGIKAEEVVGTSCHWKAFYSHPAPCLADLLINGDRETISRMFAEARMHVPEADERYEITDFFPDIGTGGKWLHITASLVRDTAGNATGAMQAVEDVTDMKKGHFVIQS